MKSNEFYEGWYDGVNSAGTTAAKQGLRSLLGRASGEMSTPDKMAQENFAKSFIGRAYSALKSAIDTGTVSVDSASVPAEEPAAPTEPTATTPTTPTTAQPQGQALDLDAYKQRREAEKAAGVQAQQQAQAQMQQTAQANAAASAADNELVAKVRAEKQKPGFQQNKGLIRQAAQKGIHESKYDQLNRLFESIISEEEQGMSIADWLTQWTSDYMQGDIDLSKYTDKISAIAKEFEAAYKTDKGGFLKGAPGREALKKLAYYVYNLALQFPRTRTNNRPTTTTTTAPTSSTPPASVNDIYKAFDRLNTAEKQKFLSMIGGAK